MPRCEVCGNPYGKTFEVRQDQSSHRFDCFECAIHALAPTCHHCGCRVIGHGVEIAGLVFCCAHCAEKTGVNVFSNRITDVVALTGNHACR